jgi:hypothetical protein
MDIDKHPFPRLHMVEFWLAKGKTKVLTSTKAREDGLVDPKVQISTNEYKKLRNNTISKRANINKVRHLGLVLCILV